MVVIDVLLWYGGSIEVGFSPPRYIGGGYKRVSIDVDHISYFELIDYVMETKCYKSKDFFMYGLDAEDGKLKHFVSDIQIMDMASKICKSGELLLEVYIQEGPLGKPLSSSQPNQVAHLGSEPIKVVGQSSSQPIFSSPLRYTKAIASRLSPLKPLLFKPKKLPVQRKLPTAQIGKRFTRSQPILESLIEAATVIGVEADNQEDSEDSQDSEDSDYNFDNDRIESSDDEEEGNDDIIHEIIGAGSDIEDLEWKQSQEAIKHAKLVEDEVNKKLIEECLKDKEANLVEGNLVEADVAGTSVLDGNSSYEESDGDIATPGDSEDDDIRGKKYKEVPPTIGEKTNWEKFTWRVGTIFASRDAFKQAVRRYAVTNGRNLYLAKSDKNKQGKG